MSTNKEWACSVAGCTASNRVCMRMAGLREGEQPKELVTFVQSELGTFCAAGIRYLNRESERLQVELAIREGKPTLEDNHGNAITPQTIAAKLMEYVRGQDYAIKRVSRSLYYFLLNREIRKNKELLKQFDLQPEQLPKLNIMMSGPSGTGKTYLWQQVQRLLGIPVGIVSMTDVTASGFVGATLEDKLGELVNSVMRYLREHGGNKDATQADAVAYIESEGAIMVLDELDKKAAPVGGENNSSGRDISGTSVQQELLTFVQGMTAYVTVGAGQQKQEIPVSTDLILFAGMGAFNPPATSGAKSLKSLVEASRPGSGSAEGVDRSEEAKKRNEEFMRNWSHYATSKNYMDYGFMQELLGRMMACHAPLNELSEEDMLYILTQVRGNRYSAYRVLFAKRGLELHITDDALAEIANRAKKANLNARGLENELSNVFVEVDMEATERAAAGYNYVYITKDVVVNNGRIIEDGENATFQKRSSSNLISQESEGVDEDA